VQLGCCDIVHTQIFYILQAPKAYDGLQGLVSIFYRYYWRYHYIYVVFRCEGPQGSKYLTQVKGKLGIFRDQRTKKKGNKGTAKKL